MSQPLKQNGRVLINKYYTRGEEIANSITHGIGAALSVLGLVVLISYSMVNGNFWQIVSFSIYGFTLTLLYIASTLYHSIQHPKTKDLFQIIDHSSIYLLIAGTYTPFLLVGLRGSTVGWTMMAIIWGIAVLGVAFKAIFADRFQVLSTLGYVGMGWLAIAMWGEILVHVPYESVIWLATGGVIYTAGVIFYALNRVPYNHAIWHLFVLGGSAAHFWAIIKLVPMA